MILNCELGFETQTQLCNFLNLHRITNIVFTCSCFYIAFKSRCICLTVLYVRWMLRGRYRLFYLLSRNVISPYRETEIFLNTDTSRVTCLEEFLCAQYRVDCNISETVLELVMYMACIFLTFWKLNCIYFLNEWL